MSLLCKLFGSPEQESLFEEIERITETQYWSEKTTFEKEKSLRILNNILSEFFTTDQGKKGTKKKIFQDLKKSDFITYDFPRSGWASFRIRDEEHLDREIDRIFNNYLKNIIQKKERLEEELSFEKVKSTWGKKYQDV